MLGDQTTAKQIWKGFKCLKFPALWPPFLLRNQTTERTRWGKSFGHCQILDLALIPTLFWSLHEMFPISCSLEWSLSSFCFLLGALFCFFASKVAWRSHLGNKIFFKATKSIKMKWNYWSIIHMSLLIYNTMNFEIFVKRDCATRHFFAHLVFIRTKEKLVSCTEQLYSSLLLMVALLPCK